MRLIGVLGVLCFAAAPVMAGPVLYEFDVCAGYIELGIIGQGSTAGTLGGTFSITVYQSDCHVGESDTFILEGANLQNLTPMALGIAGIATANVDIMSARITDFMQPEPSHIGPGGVGIAETDAYLEATVLVSGAFTTTFITGTSAGQLLPLMVTFNTSAERSDCLIANIDFVFGYEVGIPDIGLTITLDLVFQAEGTAHVVPDPALGGLTALGLGGAGAWLRRRR